MNPLPCLNCNLTICPVDAKEPPCQNVSPQTIADAVNARLDSIFGETVSAVIAVFRPKLENLNRCLECVLPQVDEVVICGDLDTVPWPPKLLPHIPYMSDKVKWVRLAMHNSGYGKKLNRGFRETNGRFVWAVNDDCFPDTDVCEKLRAHMADPTVGAVTHTLLYPPEPGEAVGKIQFAGLGRPPGHVGFGHVNHRKPADWVRPEPREEESICGASVLFRRKAFYEAGASDEDFRLYSEDAAIGLQIRQAGYRIIFEPRAVGTHIEHESTKLSGDLNPLLQESHRIFERKWWFYFEKNPNPNVLGTFA